MCMVWGCEISDTTQKEAFYGFYFIYIGSTYLSDHNISFDK